jgi:hypothetical protein
VPLDKGHKRYETAALQPLGVQRHANPVVPDNFNQVAPGTSENIKIACVRVSAKRLLNLQRQPVHAPPHVRPADRQPHSNRGGNRDHRRSRTSSTRRSVDPLTPSPCEHDNRPPARPRSVHPVGPMPSRPGGPTSPSPASIVARSARPQRPGSAGATRRPGWRSRHTAAPPATPTNPASTLPPQPLASTIPARTYAAVAACLCP